MHRYLLSCSHGRWDGAEKATRHIELCNYYVATFLGGTLDDAMADHETAWRAVHDATQELTDNLDTAIGFPLEERPDYEMLVPKFFAEFHRIAIGVLAQPTTPQPTQAQAGAVPLTDNELVRRSRVGAIQTDENGKVVMWPAYYRTQMEDRFKRGWREAEKHHGIKGGQHGTE
jgi:hypothetical protein